MRIYPIIILLLLGAIVSPVLAVEVYNLPNGDCSWGDISSPDYYYHHDTGVTEVYYAGTRVHEYWKNGTLVETNDKDGDGRVDNWFDQPPDYLVSSLVSSNPASSANFGTYLTGFSISSPVNNFQTATPTFSPKNLLSSFAERKCAYILDWK